MVCPAIDMGSTFLIDCWVSMRGEEVTEAVTVETFLWSLSFTSGASSFPSSSELSECRGLVKLRAVLTGVEEDEDEEEDEDMWEEEEEDGAALSEEEEEEEVLGKGLSGLLQECVHAAWPGFTSCVFSFSSLVTGRWFGLVRTPSSEWPSPHPPDPPSVPESSDCDELDVSRVWPERALKAWPLCSWELLLVELLAETPPPPAEEEVSKLRGPSCSGTFLISMLSFLSIRGAPQQSAAGERGEEGVWLWL